MLFDVHLYLGSNSHFDEHIFFRWVEPHQPVFSLGCGVPKVHLAAGPATRQAIIEKEGVEVRNPSCFLSWEWTWWIDLESDEYKYINVYIDYMYVHDWLFVWYIELLPLVQVCRMSIRFFI